MFNMYAVASAAVASAARITTATIQELYNTLVLVVARRPSLVSLYCIIGSGSFACASYALTHTLYIRATLARRRPAQFPLYAQRSSSSETSGSVKYGTCKRHFDLWRNFLAFTAVEMYIYSHLCMYVIFRGFTSRGPSRRRCCVVVDDVFSVRMFRD